MSGYAAQLTADDDALGKSDLENKTVTRWTACQRESICHSFGGDFEIARKADKRLGNSGLRENSKIGMFILIPTKAYQTKSRNSSDKLSFVMIDDVNESDQRQIYLR